MLSSSRLGVLAFARFSLPNFGASENPLLPSSGIRSIESTQGQHSNFTKDYILVNPLPHLFWPHFVSLRRRRPRSTPPSSHTATSPPRSTPPPRPTPPPSHTATPPPRSTPPQHRRRRRSRDLRCPPHQRWRSRTSATSSSRTSTSATSSSHATTMPKRATKVLCPPSLGSSPLCSSF